MAERHRQHPVMRALIYAALLALLVTGLLWKLDMQRALLMKIHGAAAMAGMVLLGVLLARHVPCGWKKRASRISGAALLTALLSLVLSGYALYYAGGESLRAFASQTHFWIGVALPVVFALHQGSAG